LFVSLSVLADIEGTLKTLWRWKHRRTNGGLKAMLRGAIVV